MFQFKSQITNNAGKHRHVSFSTSDNSFTRAAQTLTEAARMLDGDHALIALMRFDHPTQSFTVMQYEFDLIDGKVENLKAVQ